MAFKCLCVQNAMNRTGHSICSGDDDVGKREKKQINNIEVILQH